MNTDADFLQLDIDLICLTLSLKFDPNQPRDDSGQWSDTGGGSGNSGGDSEGSSSRSGNTKIEYQDDGSIIYRGEFSELKSSIEKNGIKGKKFNNRPKSVYMTTSEKDAHLYGVQKSGPEMSYAVVAIRVPKDTTIIPDERDTSTAYNRTHAIRIKGDIPPDWIVSVKEYNIPRSMDGMGEEDIANYMYANKSNAGALAYIAIIKKQ